MILLESFRARRRRKRAPEEVFTPKSVVSREMFARRNEPDLQGRPGLQDRVREALRDRGGRVLMYGDTGVGKSSLLRYAAEDEKLPVVSIECFSQRTYEQIVEERIGRLIDFKEVSFSDSYTAGSQMQLAVGAPQLMSVTGSTKETTGLSRSFKAVQKEPIEVLLDAMAATGRQLVVLDNFQNVGDDRTRKLVAQTMERLSDRSHETGDKKVVVIGIADDARSLLGGSGSFSRRTTEVGVPRMPDDEIRQILENGFRLLGLSAAPGILDHLVVLSDGFPYFAHLLGLAIAKAARRSSAALVTDEMVTIALRDAADQVEENYTERVGRALEAGGDVQPRRRILHLLAYDDTRVEWSSTDVTTLYEDVYGARDDWSFLLSALAALIGPKHGSILRRTGTRVPQLI